MVKKKVTTWLAQEGFPLVTTEDQAKGRFKVLPKLSVLVVFVENEDLETSSMVSEFAREHKGSVLVGYSTTIISATNQGASGRTFPTAIFTKKPKTYIWDEDGEAMTLETLKKFVEDSIAGKYVSYVKSEPIPDNEGKPVATLVGKTLEQVAFDNEKDVLVEFYAPWCGHCQNLVPIYEELGKHYLSDPNIVIAKIDATANKIPPKFKVNGFPTIIFVTADGKGKSSKQMPYDGGRNLEEFIKFIDANRNSKAIATEL